MANTGITNGKYPAWAGYANVGSCVERILVIPGEARSDAGLTEAAGQRTLPPELMQS